jgi:hypothetical protein
MNSTGIGFPHVVIREQATIAIPCADGRSFSKNLKRNGDEE